MQTQGVEVQVGQQDALGGAGGAAGIENGAAVVKLAVVRGQDGVPACGHHVIPQGVARPGQLLHSPGALAHGIQGVQGEGQLVGDLCHQNPAGLLQLWQNLGYLVVELIQSQNGLGVGEIQVKGDFAGGRQGMNHIGHGADAVQGIEAVQCLGGVGHTDGNPVALFNAHGGKAFCSGLNPLDKGGVGGFLSEKHIGRGIGVSSGGQCQLLIHGGVGILQRRGGIAVVGKPGRRCRQTHKKCFLSILRRKMPYLFDVLP